MPLRNSPSDAHADQVPVIELGRIVAVDADDWLADVLCENSGRVYQDIQITSPYLHYNNGEGIYAMPEVGAVCVVATMSDSNPPVIMAFGAAIEEMYTDEPAEPANEQELQDEGLEAPPESADEEDKAAISYRNGRPLLRPGDFCMRTRDGNFIFLRRGGVIQIGSTSVAQTIYMPVRNIIRHFAENYEMDLVGGFAGWQVIQEEDESSSCINTFTWREYAEQANVSAMMKVGDLDENFLRLHMLINGIDAKTGETQESPVIELTFSKQGDIVFACKSYTKTVEGDQTIEVGGTQTENFGELRRDVGGQQRIKFETEVREGQSSEEKLKSKLIKADSITLGSAGGAQPAVKGQDLFNWLAGHGHLFAGGAVGPPDPGAIAQLAAILSQKVKLS